MTANFEPQIQISRFYTL